jgi:hypothetical protein
VKFPEVIWERPEAEETGERSSRLIKTTIIMFMGITALDCFSI